MLVGAIMSRKPVTVGRDHTVLHVARVMREKEVGAVIVVDGRGRPIGICTDRDVTMRALLQGGNPGEIPVDRIMSKPVTAVAEGTLIFDLLRLMARKGIRRAPVVDAQDQKVVGLVSVERSRDQARCSGEPVVQVHARHVRRHAGHEIRGRRTEGDEAPVGADAR